MTSMIDAEWMAAVGQAVDKSMEFAGTDDGRFIVVVFVPDDDSDHAHVHYTSNLDHFEAIGALTELLDKMKRRQMPLN
jgi:hypothetical protein